MSLCIIPARGGSKRIPRKNLACIDEKPLVGHVIEIACSTKLFDEVIVSTDDVEIQKVAQTYGATVPFLRSASLANDCIGTIPVILDTAERLNLSDQSIICCLYPAALMVREFELRAGNNMIDRGLCDIAMAVLRLPVHPDRTFVLNGEHLYPRNIEIREQRSQDLESYYYDAGQFYFAQLGTWKELDYQRHRIGPIVMPRTRAVDIDYSEDLELAEMLFSLDKKN